MRVTANGTKVIQTIPAGQVVNAQPIVSTSETWYSPGLRIVVKSVRSDPRFGKWIYALDGIVAKEPDPSFFQVRAAYTVQDARIHAISRSNMATSNRLIDLKDSTSACSGAPTTDDQKARGAPSN